MVHPIGFVWNSLRVVLCVVFGAVCAASCAAGDDPFPLDESPAAATHGLVEQLCSRSCTCYVSDECTEYSCGISINDCCNVKVIGKEGGPCAKEMGTCVPAYAPHARQAVLDCCTGCAAPDRDNRGLFVCLPGDAIVGCGRGGAACENCNDGNPCTQDLCQEGRCINRPLGDGAACTGGRCLGGSCCIGCVQDGQCVAAGNQPATCGLGGVACKNCVDSNPCTNDACLQGSCDNGPKQNGTSCESDGNACNGKSTCQSGTCQGGTPLDCDDDNPCTDDDCDAETGCIHTDNTVACSDENPCTTGDRCRDGGCTGGAAVTCNDNNPCTTDRCDANVEGLCVNAAANNGGTCDDRNACTPMSSCSQGTCVSSTPSPCPDDGNPCTQNNCQLGPNNTPMCGATVVLEPNGTPCLSNDKCKLNTTCDAGACEGGTAKDCNDNNPCTDDACDPENGACINTPLDGDACSDGSACTLNDACQNGECAGEPVECAALDDCHAPGTCDDATGLCDDPRKADGEPCLADTGLCERGTCVVPPPPEGGAGGEGGSGSTPEGGAPGSGGEGDGAGTAGEDGVDPERGERFERKPGGCRMPPSPAPRADLVLGLGLAAAAWLLGRKNARRPRIRG